MKFSNTLLSLLVTLLPVSTLALPTDVKLPHLPKAVRDDLLKRHPSTYQVGGFNGLSARDVQGILEEHAQRTGRLDARASQNNGLKTRCRTSACMALTFDDGSYKYHKELDQTLNNAGVHATYFVNGYNYDCIYDADQVSSLRRSLKSGHQIASHTWSHVHLDSQSHSQIDKQVELLETALMKIVGVVPAFIRPPYGECNDACVEYLNNNHDLVVVNWTTDSGDSQGYSVDQSLDVYRGFKAPKHEIVLNHEVYQSTVEQLIPQAIPILKQNGYKNFVTVAEGLNLNPYKVQGAHGSRDGSWTCDGTPVPGQG